MGDLNTSRAYQDGIIWSSAWDRRTSPPPVLPSDEVREKARLKRKAKKKRMRRGK